jgi:hypothetical protein
MKKLGILLFPLVWLMARAPGKADKCLITLAAMVGSMALWAALATGVVKVLV